MRRICGSEIGAAVALLLVACPFPGAHAQPVNGTDFAIVVPPFDGSERALGSQDGATKYIAISDIIAAASAGSGGLPITGGALTGPLTLVASTTGAPSFTCPAGVAPTSPSNQQAWCTSSGFFIRFGGVTYQMASVALSLQDANNLSDVPSPASAVVNLGLEPLGTSGVKIPLLSTANTWSAKQGFAASASGGAGVNLAVGIAPTSPNNGDIWPTSTGWFGQVAGVTQQFAFVNPHTTLTTSSNTLADGGDYLIATVSSALGENLPQVSAMTEGHCIRTRDADNNAATHNVTLTAHAGDTINFFGASGTSLVAATNNFVDDFCARNGAWRVYSLGG